MKHHKKIRMSGQEDTWILLNKHGSDAVMHKFDFEPVKEPGIESTPLDCFFEILTVDIQRYSVRLVNDYATPKNSKIIQLNVVSICKLARLDFYELLKYLAVNFAKAIDKRPSLKDYWSLCDFFQTLWYSTMMPQTRYEVIHHTILCCGEVDETRSKSKIEPFLNKLVTRFQEVYYPFQELSIDEIMIK